MLSTLRTWLRGLFGDSDDATADAGGESPAADATTTDGPAAPGEVTPGTEAGGAEESPTDAGEPPEPLTCAICGTANQADAAECSLCGSSDLRPASGNEAGVESDADGGPDGSDDDGLPGAGTRTERVQDDTDADRLQEVRAEGELLVRYGDRWEPLDRDEGFRVSLPDGEQVVSSRDEVRELLRAVDLSD